MLESFSPQAFFRYQVISQVLSRLVAGETLAQAVSEASELEYYDLNHRRPRRASRSSIYRWYKIYEEKGWDGLDGRVARIIWLR